MLFSRKSEAANADRGPVQPLAAPACPANASEHRAKVLVVDDDSVTLSVVSLKLRSSGYDVVTAVNVAQALTTGRRERPDLILMDIHFPPSQTQGRGVMWNGFLILELLRRTDDDEPTPAVIISSDDPAEHRAQAARVGVTEFVRKPFRSDELLAAVSRSLSDGGRKNGSASN